MKKIIILCLFGFALTSCSKDSLDPNADSFSKPVKSEIMVLVTYLNWTDHSENSCGNNGSQDPSYLVNAKVELYPGVQDDGDALGVPQMNATTDHYGSALLKEIEPSTYTVIVDTRLGRKSRTITTQLHKRSFIDFSF